MRNAYAKPSSCKICKGDDARSETGPGMLIYIMASEVSDSRLMFYEEQHFSAFVTCHFCGYESVNDMCK